MQIETQTSFGRDSKKLPDSVLDEVKTIYEAIERVQSLDDLTYSVRKWPVVRN